MTEISNYTEDGVSKPIKNEDLLDFSNEDGFGAYNVSKKILVSELLTFLQANAFPITDNRLPIGTGTGIEDSEITIVDFGDPDFIYISDVLNAGATEYMIFRDQSNGETWVNGKLTSVLSAEDFAQVRAVKGLVRIALSEPGDRLVVGNSVLVDYPNAIMRVHGETDDNTKDCEIWTQGSIGEDIIMKLRNDGYLNLKIGTNINEFSIDGTLAGDSDDALPTEKSVKTYVDTNIATAGLISGVLTGLDVTVNADPTKFDVAAGTGIVVDWSTPATPVFTTVVFAGATAVTVPDIASGIFTTLYITAGGVLTQKAAGVRTTAAERRQNIVLDSLVHPNLTNISMTGVTGILAYQSMEAVNDYIRDAGQINVGNTYSAASTNLTVAKATGTTTLPWINKNNDLQNPSVLSNAAQSPLTSGSTSEVYQDGVGGFTFVPAFTAIDPDLYDDGDGTLGAVPNNQWTIRRLYFFGQTNGSLITYGQATYSSLADAQNAIFTEDPTLPDVASTGVFRGVLIVQEGATDLSNAGQAKFIDIIAQTSSVSSSGVVSQSDIVQEINAQTGTSYTLTDADHGKLVTLDNVGAIALDVDTGLRSDFGCIIMQKGAGEVTVGGTATINEADSFTKLAKQWASASVKHLGSDVYWLQGRLKA